MLSSNREELRALFAKSFFFGTLSDSDIDGLLTYARAVRYRAGSEIFAKGSPGSSLMVVLKGTVRISSPSETGREITLLTNDLDAPAEQIAALYKDRWQVELFFKWLKQNLAISHFIGTSRNAVTIQIMAALIGYLLLRIASLRYAGATGLQAVARLMPATLLTRRPLADLLRPPPTRSSGPNQTDQLSLAYA